MKINLVYNWLNLETNRKGTGIFNASHHWVFSDPMGEPIRLIEKIKLELINKWNRQQPNTWKYSIE